MDQVALSKRIRRNNTEPKVLSQTIAREADFSGLENIKDIDKWAKEFEQFLDSLYYVLRNRAQDRQYKDVQKFVDSYLSRKKKDQYRPQSVYKYVELPVKADTVNTEVGKKNAYKLIVTSSSYESDDDGEPDYDREGFSLEKFPEEGFSTIQEGFDSAYEMAERGKLVVKISDYAVWYNSFETANYAAFRLQNAEELEDYNIAKNKKIPMIVEWRPRKTEELVISPILMYKLLNQFDPQTVKRALINNKSMLSDIKDAVRQLDKAYQRNGKYVTIASHTKAAGTTKESGVIAPLRIYKPDRSSARLQKDPYSARVKQMLEKFQELKIDDRG